MWRDFIKTFLTRVDRRLITRRSRPRGNCRGLPRLDRPETCVHITEYGVRIKIDIQTDIVYDVHTDRLLGIAIRACPGVIFSSSKTTSKAVDAGGVKIEDAVQSLTVARGGAKDLRNT